MVVLVKWSITTQMCVAHKDGFTDEGQEPVACVPWGWTSKWLTLMPECQLMP